MIKIDAPDDLATQGVRLALRAKNDYPDRAYGHRNCVLYTTNCGHWAVWRVQTGWVARWHGNEKSKGPTE